MEVNRTTVGIEVDGPSHYVYRKATGRTLLKRRQVNTLDEILIVSVLIGSGMILVRTVRRGRNNCAICCVLDSWFPDNSCGS